MDLHAWKEFYLLVGPSAAVLIGLLFVVVSVGPETIASRSTEGTRAFVTPTMVFFTTALAVSGLMLAPHVSAKAIAVLLGTTSLSGLLYLFWVRGHKHWRAEKLDGEDWIFYIGLPFLAYLLIAAAAIAFWMRSADGPILLALSMMMLLLVGIHNAWDIVIYLVQKRRA